MTPDVLRVRVQALIERFLPGPRTTEPLRGEERLRTFVEATSIVLWSADATGNVEEDLPLLVAELLRRGGFEPGPIRGPALEVLSGHDWPGNVRELRNVLERALVLSRGAHGFEELRLSLQAQGTGPEVPLRTDLPFAEAKQAVVDAFERHYLRDVLSRAGGNLSEASRQAGVDRKHLRALARRHGLLPDEPE